MRHHRAPAPSRHRSPRALAGGAAALAAVTGLAVLTPPATGASTGPDEERRLLVRLSGPPALATVDAGALSTKERLPAAARIRLQERREELRSAQRELVAAGHDADVDLDVRHSFTDLTHAMAVTVGASDVGALSRLPGVASVEPDERVQIATDVSVPLVGAPDVWQRDAPGGVSARGAGQVVAVLDSGVDYTNPSLGGAFGAGHKVVDGYDFVNDDDDPMDDNGHGTHVAGIIAGDGDVTGVAPEASITAYKVVDAGGGGWESDIIAGLEEAVDPGNPNRADVVNMSLGGPGDGTDPLGQAASSAAEAGVVVVASAGNSGPGAQTVTSPALAEGVLSVGASTSGIRLPTAHMIEPRREKLQVRRAPFSASPPAQPVSGELVDVGRGTAEDYERVGDVGGKVVAYRSNIPGDVTLVSPGLIEQARRAEERGALAAIAYTSSSGPVGAPTHGTGHPTAVAETLAADSEADGTVEVQLTDESGDSFRMDDLVVLAAKDMQWSALQRELAQGTVKIEVSGEDVTDRIASFSSRGPAPDHTIEPDLVAPGVEIRSAWPKAQWKPGVYRLSGTSMAAPHVAGAAALLRQLRPEAGVDDVRGRLVGSATAVEDTGPTTSGAGRLDVAAAASAPLTATPTALSFGLADLSGPMVSEDDTVVLRNHADRSIGVELRAEQAPGGPGGATVSPAQASIPAGGELEVRVEVSAKRPTRKEDLSGWVVAEVDGTDRLRVPYLLAVRPLVVQTSPDPSDGTSEAFVWSPVAVEEKPTLTVTPPRGRTYEVTAEHDHGNWYRADLAGKHPGAYTVDAAASTSDGVQLVGEGTFEVADDRWIGGPGGWEPIGPNGQAGQITTTPADSDVAVVQQYTKAGPWLTDDAGTSWRQQNRLPVAGGTGEIVVDAQDSRRMWYAVNGSTGGVLDTMLDPTYEGRVLRSEDAGRTWQPLELPDVHVEHLVSDAETRALVAVTADSLLVSRDRGDSWESHPNPAGSDLVGAAVGGEDVFVADRASVWALRGLVDGVPTSAEQVYDPGEASVDALVADDALVAVLTSDDVVVGSRDAGQVWEPIYEIADGGAMEMVMDGGTLMVSTYREHQYLGRDHGRTWTRVVQPVRGAIENDLAHWPGDSLLWSSPGAGLFRTDPDGSNPERIGVQGLTAHDLAVTADPEGSPRLLAGTDSDVFDTGLPDRMRLPSEVGEWGLSGSEAHVGTRVGQLEVSAQDRRTVWKVRKDALSSFWVYRSTDGGEEWEQRGKTTELPLDLMVGPQDEDRVVVPFWSLRGAGLYVTSDAGETWRKLFHDEMFTTVAADDEDPETLWLGSASGLYRSDDFGATVEQVTDHEVTSVEVDGDRIVVGGRTVQVSDDGGATFSTADTGELPMVVSDLVVSPVDADTWYAATSAHAANGLVKGGRGVLRSTDGGRTWVNVSLGLQNLDVVSLVLSPDGRWLFAGTAQGGVHRTRAR